MTKHQEKKLLSINMHSFLRILAPRIPEDVGKYFKDELNCSLHQPESKIEETDILIDEIQSPLNLSVNDKHMRSIFGFWITEYKGETSVVLDYHGTPDIIIQFSKPLKIYYRNRSGLKKRLYAILNFCIRHMLAMKKCLLCHGAVIEYKGKGLLIAGHRGTGKTQLLLTLLRQGFNCLSDDKFILQNGYAYSMQNFVKFKNYHINTLSSINAPLPKQLKGRMLNSLRDKTRSIIINHVPRAFIPSANKIFNPTYTLPFNAFSPKSKSLDSIQLNKTMFLVNGNSFKIDEIEKNDFIKSWSLDYKMVNDNIANLKEMITLYLPETDYNPSEIMNHNLKADAFLKVAIPADINPAVACKEILKNFEPG